MDCRLVNSALDPAKSDRFPLPLISELHRKMSKHSIYTIIDLSQCFHSFEIHYSSRKFLSFTDPTTGQQYMHSKAPMGLTPLSSFVQRQLTNLFADLNDVTTNFIDDIAVHTEADMATHIKYVKIVIDRLTKANLTINVAKTHLAQKSINILGFCLSEKGLAVDQRKVSNILDWNPVCQNSKELASRLGLINFFRSHLPCLSQLTAPLDAIKIAPDITKVWTEDHTIAMKKIQQLMVNAPVLSAPDMAHDIHLVTDSSADSSFIESDSNKKLKLSIELESKIANTNAAKANEPIISSEKKENDHNENKASTDQDLFIYASHLDIYEQPKDESEKKTLLFRILPRLDHVALKIHGGSC
ncbi:hypothetical protein, partial, partial [Parasitella parasitica]